MVDSFRRLGEIRSEIILKNKVSLNRDEICKTGTLGRTGQIECFLILLAKTFLVNINKLVSNIFTPSSFSETIFRTTKLFQKLQEILKLTSAKPFSNKSSEKRNPAIISKFLFREILEYACNFNIAQLQTQAQEKNCFKEIIRVSIWFYLI